MFVGEIDLIARQRSLGRRLRRPAAGPVAAILASRAANLASCSACSRAWRSLARASIFVRASAILRKRSSRRASSSGIDMPSGISASSAASALAPDRAQLQHAHLARQQQHLNEQTLYLCHSTKSLRDSLRRCGLSGERGGGLKERL
jgi:hypothetical protein